MLKITKFLFFVIFLFLISLNISMAQESGSECKTKDCCLKNFDLEKTNYLDPFLPESAKSKVHELRKYFKCKAALTNDLNECNKLNPVDAQTCRENFNLHNGYYAGLLALRTTKQPPTRELMNACLKDVGVDLKSCKVFLDAFANEDSSICQNAPFNNFRKECEAIIKLDASLSSSMENIAKISYIKAIRDFSIEECKNIPSQHLERRMECEAYISGNIKQCEQYDGFRQFRDAYCSSISNR